MFVKLSVELDNKVCLIDFEGKVCNEDGKNNLYQLITVSLSSKSSILICAIPMKFFLSILPKFPQIILYRRAQEGQLLVRVRDSFKRQNDLRTALTCSIQPW